MNFVNLSFIFIFLPISVILYYLMPNLKLKNFMLLFVSLVFYALAKPVYILLLAAVTLINWAFSLLIEKNNKINHIKAKLFLVISIVFSLLPLVFFKYSSFFIEKINIFFRVNLETSSLVLPLGLSYYSFKLISYIVDVYKEKISAEKNYLNILLYISMFPQVIQGPILRYEDIGIQLTTRKTDAIFVTDGIVRFVVGLGKKLLLANELGKISENILKENLEEKPVLYLWLGIFSYGLQLYYDFSGYSDMALGLGKLFGFDFSENFDFPYVSKSISEFWRRWHISLGHFFRDYIYIPLGGNKKHQVFNLLVVWLLTGLWHGGSWNFIIWGLYFFVLLVIEKFIFKNSISKIPLLSNIITLFLVLVGWILFYFTDISSCLTALKIMFGFAGNAIWAETYTTYLVNKALLLVLGIIGCIPWGKKIYKNMKSLKEKSADLWFILTIIFILLIMYFCISSIIGSGYNAFLYEQF